MRGEAMDTQSPRLLVLTLRNRLGQVDSDLGNVLVSGDVRALEQSFQSENIADESTVIAL
jgi:hypothetical protein